MRRRKRRRKNGTAGTKKKIVRSLDDVLLDYIIKGGE